MAAQSFAMGEAFGKGFQYGKRRISAQTNEEFNKMSAKDHFNETTADIKSMIPEMKAAMSSFAFLQQDIIKELIGYIKDTTGTVIEEVKDIHTQVSDDFRAFFGAPPVAAKLASEAGVRALLSWWDSIGILPALTGTTNIVNRVKTDFAGYSPTTWILDQIKKQMAAFIGPFVPADGITSPVETQTPEPDTRIVAGTLRAPDSIVIQYKKDHEQFRSWMNVGVNCKTDGSGTAPSGFSCPQVIKNLNAVASKIWSAWQKYNLTEPYYDKKLIPFYTIIKI